MCNTQALDWMGTHVGRLTYPLRDTTGQKKLDWLVKAQNDRAALSSLKIDN